MRTMLLALSICAISFPTMAIDAPRPAEQMERPIVVPAKGREKCKTCNTPLNDHGRCPICQPEPHSYTDHCWSWFELVDDQLYFVSSCDGGRP